MKYDRDLIEAMYIVQQKDEALAERMWYRLTTNSGNNADFYVKQSDVYVNQSMIVPYAVIEHLRSHGMNNKVKCIKLLREKMGWGLKESLDAVVAMGDKGILNY